MPAALDFDPMKPTYLFVILAFALGAIGSLGGCGSDSSTDPPPTSSLDFPTAVGSSWSYGDSASVEVVGTTSKDGTNLAVFSDGEMEDWYSVSGSTLLWVPDSHRNIDPNEGQIFQWLAQLFAENWPYRILDLNRPANEPWMLMSDEDSYFLGPDTVVVRFAASAMNLSDQTVTVPAGTFECKVCQYGQTIDTFVSGDLFSGDLWMVTNYIAPGVGIVRQVQETSKERIELSLTSYDLASFRVSRTKRYPWH